jgi:hypothetical protein
MFKYISEISTLKKKEKQGSDDPAFHKTSPFRRYRILMELGCRVA